MPLTEEQKRVRQQHFPGRRGFLPPDQQQASKVLVHSSTVLVQLWRIMESASEFASNCVRSLFQFIHNSAVL
jgi:hypothetical protein